jgi:hypothetical protein
MPKVPDGYMELIGLEGSFGLMTSARWNRIFISALETTVDLLNGNIDSATYEMLWAIFEAEDVYNQEQEEYD